LSGKEKQEISVVIPCLNGAATLGRCLEALAAQTLAPREIIVADNGSSDGSQAIVQRWMMESELPLRLIEVPQRGAAAARNAAVREADSAWIAFTDSDCMPEPAWLATGAALLAENGDIAALAGPAWGTLEGDLAARMLGLTSLSVGIDARRFSDAGDTGTQGFAAANLWVRRQALLDAGGFDETLAVAGEDIDLCARLYAAGGRLLYAPELKVRHIHPSGMAGMWRKMVQYGRAHPMLAARYGRPGIYLDLPLLGRKRFPCRRFIWCNLASAEKKVLLILLLGCWQVWLWLLLPLYLYTMGRGLAKRAAALGADCGTGESMGLAVLLVLKSAAMSWGRLCGSSTKAVTC